MFFHTLLSAIATLTNAQGQTPVSSKDQRFPSVRRGLSESTSPYSDVEGRYPIIGPIGPFIFCLLSRESGAQEGTNQIALCKNSLHWINHTSFTRTDLHFTSSSRVPFPSCSCASVCMLISVMKYLISHTGATKRNVHNIKQGKKHYLTTITVMFTQIHTEMSSNVHLLKRVCVLNTICVDIISKLRFFQKGIRFCNFGLRVLQFISTQ